MTYQCAAGHTCVAGCPCRNGQSESRRSRQLVLSFFSTVVNYEYAFYWYLYQVRDNVTQLAHIPSVADMYGCLRPCRLQAVVAH
jgi:hypothetical protein